MRRREFITRGDAPHGLGLVLLRAQSEWPRSRRSNNCSDEIAASHCQPQGADYAE